MKAPLATVVHRPAAPRGSGCGGDDGGGDDARTRTDGDGARPTTCSSYETITDLNEALGAAGIECALDYEGLVDEVREISQCTIEGARPS